MVFMWAYGKFLKNGNLLNKKNKELELLLQKLKLFSLKDRGRKLYSTPLVMGKKLYQPYENLILACNPVTRRFLSCPYTILPDFPEVSNSI